jgi:citrate lyase subunit beta/citryl-CoA lyase
MNADLRQARSLLFVPGNRPDRFEKAWASGADGVVLDLEDAVPPEDRAGARTQVQGWLDRAGVVVRINEASTADFVEDLALLAGSRAVVMLAKTERPEQVAATRTALGPGGGVIPLIETAAGVLASAAICGEPGVIRAALGGVDLAAQLGIADPRSPTLSWAYSTVVLASAAAGVGAPLASPTLQVDDRARVLEDSRHARDLGFGGKLCIHPSQIEPAHEAFAFTESELRWARRVLEVEASGAATQLDGQMLDRPVFDRARRILAGAPSHATSPRSQKESHP